MSIRGMACWSVGALMFIAIGSLAQQSPSEFTKTLDIVYGTVDGRELKLDLYMPAEATNPPLLVYVHGGAWRRGSKDSILTTTFVEDGYAMASLDFRLSGEAMFPAQIHDIKAAIRFLRGNAVTLGYDATRLAILGTSSGAHLATVVGVTNGHDELEGEVGEHLEQSSDVQAIVSYYGASNLTTILKQSTPHGLSVRAPALDLLLGGQPDEQLELARLASPVFHVEASDPPLLILHGDQDPQMPINQSHELHHAYKEGNLQVQFEVVHGAAHGGRQFSDEKRNALVEAFLDEQLH
ncbi:MAG: alpha/beta hydrolase [Gammaproteobacteria bacterium]